MTTPTSRSLACLLALALAAGGAIAQTPKVSRALPGAMHVGALVNLQSFLQTFPELGSEGFISEQLDILAARGVPDPRTELQTLALGTQLGKPNGVTEGVALGTSDLLVVPAIRELAEQEGVDLEESAYQGVVYVTGTYQGRTSRFGDITEDVMVIAYDQANAYDTANWCVDTVKLQRESFWDQYGKELTPGTFVTARMTLSSAVRRAVADTPLEHLQHIVSGWVDLTGTSSQVKMHLRAKATSTLKAMFAIGLLQDKLEELADESPDPAVRRLLLEQTTLKRRGSSILMDTNSPRSDFVAGILALEELLRGNTPG